MDLVINIPDRIYHEFTNWCDVNSLVPTEFVYDAFYDKFMVEKYGDINKILNKTEKKQQETNQAQKQEKEIKQPITQPVTQKEEKVTPVKEEPQQQRKVVKTKTLSE